MEEPAKRRRIVIQDLGPLVRIVDTASDAWHGCGFVVPPLKGSNKLHVMTCAHVVGTALGNGGSGDDIATGPDRPDGSLELVFAAATGADALTPHVARVAEGGWFPVLDRADAGDRPHDIAILEIDVAARPQGVEFGAFRPGAERGCEVYAYGPRLESRLTLDGDPFWVDGKIRPRAVPGEIEFLAGGHNKDNRIIPGFSGSPLMDNASWEILGMVRAVRQGDYMWAYAVPYELLSRAWPALDLSRTRDARSREIHPVFDSIDRREHVRRVEHSAGPYIGRRGDAAGAAGRAPVFVVSGPYEEDHEHLGQRLCDVLGRHRDRAGGSAAIAVQRKPLFFPRSGSPEEIVTVLTEDLAEPLRAETATEAGLVAALDRGGQGWMVHILVRAETDTAGTDALAHWLERWDRLAAATQAELYLTVSLLHDPAQDTDGPLTRWKRGLLAAAGDQDGIAAAMAHCTLVPLDDLPEVDHLDVDAWQESLEADPDLDTAIVPWLLTDAVQAVFAGAQSLPMKRLRTEIKRAGIDPFRLEGSSR